MTDVKTGGKIAILASDKRDVFEATAVVHPAMVDPKDAKPLTNPIMVLASKDEPAEDIKNFEAELSESVRSKSVFKTYDTMHHGSVTRSENVKNNR